MHCIRSFLILICLFAALLGRAGESPAPVDPMLWTPPAELPTPRECVPLEKYTPDVAKVLTGVRKKRAEFAPLPDRAMLIHWVNKNSPAEKLNIKPGDFLLKVDGAAVVSYEEFSAQRKEAPQKFTLFTPGRGEREIDVPAGKVGISFSDWRRLQPIVFDLPRDPKWNEHLQNAEQIFPQRMDLVETALFHAVKAGCPFDARLQTVLARVALSDLRYGDAMALSRAAINAPEVNDAAEIFMRAALADYKLPAAIEAIERNMSLSYEKRRLPELQKLVARHSSLPPNQRERLSPRAQADALFWDPLVPRAKVVEYARDTAEKFIAWLDEWTEMPFDSTTRELQNFSFGPEVSNVRIAFEFSMRETNVDSGEKHLAVGVVDMDREARCVGQTILDHRWRNWKIDKPAPGASGFILNQVSALFRPGSAQVVSWMPGQSVELSESVGIDPNETNAFEMIVWNGQVEMTLNGKRLYYGPLDQDKPRLTVTVCSSGITARLKRFVVSELIDPKDLAAKIKPVVNERYRRGNSRLHYAGAFLPERMVHTLLDLGADPNLRGSHESTPMHHAIQFRSDKREKEIVARMLEKGGKLDLPLAAVLGDRAKIEAMIKADPNCVKVTQPWSPLLAPIWYEDVEMVKLLLDKGADVDAPSPGSIGRTPLISAVLGKNRPIFDLLLERGANVNLGDRNRNTALYYARGEKQTAMEAELVKRKAVLKADAPNSVPVKPPAPPTGDF